MQNRIKNEVSLPIEQSNENQMEKVVKRKQELYEKLYSFNDSIVFI